MQFPQRQVFDRTRDERTAVGGVLKPAVLGRGTQRRLCLVCLAFVVYGTLGPVGGAGGPWIRAVEHWRWVPISQRSDRNDVVTNVLVYVPVGVAFRMLVRRRGRAGWADFAVALALSGGLSYTTEVLQQALPGRSSNRVDLFVNTLAAAIGCCLAVPVQRLLRHAHAAVFVGARMPDRGWGILGWAAIGGATLLMTVPFRLRWPQAEWGFDAPAEFADLRRVAMFGAVGFALAARQVLQRPGSRWALAGSTALTMLIAFALEALQAILAAHSCSVREGLVAGAGGVAGSVLAACATATVVRRRRLMFGVLVAMVAYLAFSGLWQLGTAEGIRAVPRVNWVPFQAQFRSPVEVMVTDVVEQIALYGTIALLVLFATRGHGAAAGLLLIVGVLGPVEVCRAYLAGSQADVTAPLLAVLAWLAALHVWRAIDPPACGRGAPPTDRTVEISC